MVSKLIVITVLVACMRSAFAGFAAPISYAAPAVYASAPVAYAAPVAKAVIAESYAPANYDFGYSVSDPHTGDQKSQVESRRGDAVQGSYSLVDSDGTRRVVDYSADGVNGFNAVVRKEPLTVAAPVIKTVAAAPVARIAAPVVAAYAAAPAHAHFAAAPALATYAAAPVHAHYAAAPALSHYSAVPTLSHYAAAPAFAHYAGGHALSYSSPLIAKYH